MGTRTCRRLPERCGRRVALGFGNRRRIHRARGSSRDDRALHAAFVQILDRADFVGAKGATALEHEPELPFCALARARRLRIAIRA